MGGAAVCNVFARAQGQGETKVTTAAGSWPRPYLEKISLLRILTFSHTFEVDARTDFSDAFLSTSFS